MPFKKTVIPSNTPSVEDTTPAVEAPVVLGEPNPPDPPPHAPKEPKRNLEEEMFLQHEYISHLEKVLAGAREDLDRLISLHNRTK